MPCYPTGFEHSSFEPESWTQEIIVTCAKGSRRSQGLHLPARAVRDSFVIDLMVDLQMAMLAWQTLINLKNVEKLVFRWDPDKISLQDLFCAGYMLCEMVVREQETQVFTFRDDSWLRHDWRILKLGLWEVDTFSDSRNCEYHRRVGFWVQAPEGDWARGWQKYGEESCVIKRFCPKQGFGWIVFTGKLFQRQLPALYETDSCSSCAKVSEHNVIIL